MVETIELKATDGVRIVGDYYSGKGHKFALLLHMMPSNRSSWTEFAQRIHEQGFDSLAIDERGHGGSEGGPNAYKTFSDQQQRSKMLDVNVAWRFLEQRGATFSNTIFVGASIGANLVIRALNEYPMLSSVVAISPGLNYRGVSTDDVFSDLQSHQRVMLVAATADVYSANSVRALHQLAPDLSELYLVDGHEHGTDMFVSHEDLVRTIIGWMNDRV